MKPDELRELLKQPESETLEFKVRLPDPRLLAKTISAFANTSGGVLIVGVEEGGEVVGIQEPARAQRTLQEATLLISPPPSIRSEIVPFDGKRVFVVEIAKGHQSPYLAEGRAYQVRDGHLMPLTATVLYTGIVERTKDVDELLPELKRLTVELARLNEELIAGRSLRTRIPEWVAAGIVGALISLALTALLGAG